VIGAFLDEKFWPDLYNRANDEPEPPVAPFVQMKKAIEAGIEPEQVEKWIDEAMRATTGSQNTHPCLADRLSAMGERPRPPSPVSETAAEHFFGKSFKGLLVALNQQWKDWIINGWKERYAEAQQAKERLGELEKKAEGEPLCAEELWERACLIEEYRPRESAFLIYEEVLRVDPEHAGASFMVGRQLLLNEDEMGIPLIEQAMSREEQYLLPGCELAYDFLMHKGRSQEAEIYYKRAERQSQRYEMAREERARLRGDDKYISHGLQKEHIESLSEQLSEYPQVAEAHLVRKQLEHYPEYPLYVLGITVRGAWYKYKSEIEDEKLAQLLAQELRFDSEFFVIIYPAADADLEKVMRNIPGSRVYTRR
jgi:hypothetical protein